MTTLLKQEELRELLHSLEYSISEEANAFKGIRLGELADKLENLLRESECFIIVPTITDTYRVISWDGVLHIVAPTLFVEGESPIDSKVRFYCDTPSYLEWKHVGKRVTHVTIDQLGTRLNACPDCLRMGRDKEGK